MVFYFPGLASITTLICASRKLVGQFKYSSNMTSRLHVIQTELSLPQYQLLDDVATRWNYISFMME